MGHTLEAVLLPAQLMMQSLFVAEHDAIPQIPAAKPALRDLRMHEVWTIFDVGRCQQSYRGCLCWRPASVRWQAVLAQQ